MKETSTSSVDNSFWIVWSPRNATNSSVMHSSLHIAAKEAERLAKLNPENPFYVMEAQCSVEARQTYEFISVRFQKG